MSARTRRRPLRVRAPKPARYQRPCRLVAVHLQRPRWSVRLATAGAGGAVARGGSDEGGSSGSYVERIRGRGARGLLAARRQRDTGGELPDRRERELLVRASDRRRP